MKVALEVGGQNIVMTYKETICLNCRKCDLETWEKRKWKDGSSPDACKGWGVCSPTLVACSQFEPRTLESENTKENSE